MTKSFSVNIEEASEEMKAQHTSAVRVPLIVHIIFRLDVGGLENGLVNLINRTPPGVIGTR